MARIIDCPCGHRLKGEDDNELFRLGREHADRDHPDMKRTDEEIRARARADARDAVAERPASMGSSETIRRRLEIQGFTCLDDKTLREVGPWLRFTPGVCTAIVAVGTALALPALLWALVPIAVLGAIFPRHPFDYVYNLALRRVTRTDQMPRNGAPRRFACGMAAVWIAATAAAFTVGITPVGYALGGVLAAVGLLVSTTHFCIPSLIYRIATGSLNVSSADLQQAG